MKRVVAAVWGADGTHQRTAGGDDDSVIDVRAGFVDVSRHVASALANSDRAHDVRS